MVLEQEILSFFQWLLPDFTANPMRLGAILVFLLNSFAVLLVGLVTAYLIAALRHGPGEAFYVVAQGIATGLREFRQSSSRRTGAIALLSIKEAIRRRVVIGFAVFLVMLLFAGWFIDAGSDQPARLYLAWVLTAANYLVLIVALFLSVFSLPTDIKTRTIYTVVTKPVRATEIVFGRILGFVAVGTSLIALMGLVSYVFVRAGLSHSHEVAAATVHEVDSASPDDPNPIVAEGETTLNSRHRHRVSIRKDGTGETNEILGHRHAVRRVEDSAGKARYEVGPPVGMLRARIPIYADTLRFLDRSGAVSTKGINVGDMWEYRSYIEGRSEARAIWTFSDINERRFPNGLPLELTLGVFRTHKGTIVDPISGSLILRNPDLRAKIRESVPIPFAAQEFVVQAMTIPKTVPADVEGKLETVNVFQDLVGKDGRLEILVRCEEPGQYYGMARYDMYLKAAEGAFSWNFVKGHLGIWMQMTLITAFGVLFSTFLSSPVAMLATGGAFVLGFFSEFVYKVASGAVQGGGPIEASYRMITQMNQTIDMDPTLGSQAMKAADFVIMLFMQAFAYVLPNYGWLDTSEFVASGYNIPWELLSQHIATVAAFLVGVVTVGYFLFKSREVAA